MCGQERANRKDQDRTNHALTLEKEGALIDNNNTILNPTFIDQRHRRPKAPERWGRSWSISRNLSWNETPHLHIPLHILCRRKGRQQRHKYRDSQLSGRELRNAYLNIAKYIPLACCRPERCRNTVLPLFDMGWDNERDCYLFPRPILGLSLSDLIARSQKRGREHILLAILKSPLARLLPSAC